MGACPRLFVCFEGSQNYSRQNTSTILFHEFKNSLVGVNIKKNVGQEDEIVRYRSTASANLHR